MSTTDWQAKATMCELLALSLRYPDEQLAEIVASGEWLDAAHEVAVACGCALPESIGRESLAASPNGTVAPGTDALLHALRAEATHLFVGAPDPAVWPFEGVWRAEDDGVQAYLFVNPHSLEVEHFCKACGLGHPEGTKDPLDHIAAELELLQYLAALEAGIAVPAEDSVAATDLPGGSPAAAYAQFMDEHFMVWAPRFAEKLCAEARLPFYRAVGQLLGAFLA